MAADRDFDELDAAFEGLTRTDPPAPSPRPATVRPPAEPPPASRPDGAPAPPSSTNLAARLAAELERAAVAEKKTAALEKIYEEKRKEFNAYVERSSRAIQEHKSRIKELEKQLADVQRQRDALEGSTNAGHDVISRLERKVADLNKTSDSGRIAELERTIGERDERIVRLESAVEQLNAIRGETAVDTLRGLLSERENELEDRKALLERRIEELEERSAQMSHLQGELAVLETDRRAEMTDLRELLAERDTEIGRLKMALRAERAKNATPGDEPL